MKVWWRHEELDGSIVWMAGTVHQVVVESDDGIWFTFNAADMRWEEPDEPA